MRTLPGSFSSRNGAAWSQGWAADRRRSEARTASHGTASLQETVTPPSQEAMRRAIEADCCPFCGAGPYKNLGLHSLQGHGVSAADLRELSGLKTVCSDALSAGSRERLEKRPDREEITKRATKASKERGAQRIALKASLKPRLAAMEERDPVIVRRARAGDRLSDIASDLGITTMTVWRSLKRLGVTPALAQTNDERRARLAQNREAAVASRSRSLTEERDRRLRRFVELGGDWRAVGELAKESGTSEKTMRSFLRQSGVALPDGRKNPARRADR